MTRDEAIERAAFDCADCAVATVSLNVPAEQALAAELLWTDERLTEAGFEPMATALDFAKWRAAYDAAIEELADDDDTRG